jgi:hypothetical protein
MVAEQFHDEISCRHVRGVPRELISDRDLRFTASSSKTKRFWEAFQRRLGTCTRFTTARNHSANGATERAIAVVEEILMMYLGTSITKLRIGWDFFAINNSPSSALKGVSPIFLRTRFQSEIAYGFTNRAG